MKQIKYSVYTSFFLLLSIVFGISAIAQNNAKSKKAPNLLIILADQWRGQALGFEGKEPVMTPFLDNYAKESLVLGQMVSNYPVCSPARAMSSSTDPNSTTAPGNESHKSRCRCSTKAWRSARSP